MTIDFSNTAHVFVIAMAICVYTIAVAVGGHAMSKDEDTPAGFFVIVPILGSGLTAIITGFYCIIQQL